MAATRLEPGARHSRGLRTTRLAIAWILAGLALVLLVSTARDAASAQQPSVYYVDSGRGNDEYDGQSPERAWRTLRRLRNVTLKPGDTIRLRRDRTFKGTLNVEESGTGAAPITINAYGRGDRPRVDASGHTSAVRVDGSHVRVTELRLTDATWAGVEIFGDHVEVSQSLMTGNTAGAVVASSATENRIVENEFRENTGMSVLTPGGNDDSGAFGVLLNGDGNEVAHNTFAGHSAFSYDYGTDGAAIEIFNGSSNHVHHNRSYNDDTFTELGRSSRGHARDNVFSYNVVYGDVNKVAFVVRGEGVSLGPTPGTQLLHNTVSLTHPRSDGFVLEGTGTGILSLQGNIIHAARKAGYADDVIDDRNNLYSGRRQFRLGATSITGDPRFVDAADGDLRLRADSPAVDGAGADPGYRHDVDGVAVPQDGDGDGTARPDLGAFERSS